MPARSKREGLLTHLTDNCSMAVLILHGLLPLMLCPQFACRDYCIVGQQFNFQRASCGLDAGVSIYAKRVDSVYDSVHQTLGMAVQVNGEPCAHCPC